MRRILDLKGKHVLVMGLGLHGGGLGTVRFLAHAGANLLITDLRPERVLRPSLKELARYKHITYRLGEHRESDFLKAELIVKNPGVPPDSPFLRAARAHKIPITSDMGIFFALCPAMIIGITGTRGKSTTASLISLFLQAGFKRLPRGTRPRVFLGGNIRKSVLEFLEKLRPHDIVIIELSSFQLDDLDNDTWIGAKSRKSPDIAVFTNILRDHLNRHGSLQKYIRAKSVIFRYQRKTDHLFVNPHDPLLKKIARGAPAHVHVAELNKAWRPLVDEILGPHYRQSVALAASVAYHVGVKKDAIERVFRTFRGLEGRQQSLASIHGVHVVNDTTATIPDAAIVAIDRFRSKAGTHKLILIAGGQDKELDFRPLAKTITKSVDVLVLLPGTGTEKLLRESGIMNHESRERKREKQLTISRATSMKEAVQRAFTQAHKGDYIVFSPGAASFGLFLNEFDRGAQFLEAVRHYKK